MFKSTPWSGFTAPDCVTSLLLLRQGPAVEHVISLHDFTYDIIGVFVFWSDIFFSFSTYHIFTWQQVRSGGLSFKSYITWQVHLVNVLAVIVLASAF